MLLVLLIALLRQAKNVGCSGLIIPDIPPEEEADERFIYHCNKNRIHHIRFLSPVSTDERIKKNVEIANGFIYCASRQGTPGEGFYLNSVLKNFLGRVKSHTNLPLAVGFGILEHRVCG